MMRTFKIIKKGQNVDYLIESLGKEMLSPFIIETNDAESVKAKYMGCKHWHVAKDDFVIEIKH